MKNFLFLSILFLGLGLTSCKDDEMHDHNDDADYKVTVTIESPTADAEVTMGEPMEVAVKFVHDEGKTVHNVKIEVQDADGNSVMVLDEGHKHEESGTYTYQASDWTPTEHGTYTLYAETSNDAGEATKSATASFTVAHEISDEYPVTVTIVSPETGSTNTVSEAVHIHITMVHNHSETIHNAKVEVKDADGNVVMTMLDDHVHDEDGNYEFHSMDFVPSAAGTYSVHAETTNHDGALPQHAHADFTVQ
jgi:flagellar hook assembly protein FlgD